jgi:hypothetical protein
MRVRIIGQGFGGRPFQQALVSALQDDSFVSCWALIAFVTYDGLLRIGPEPEGALHRFLDSRTRQVNWVVGADTVTTAEALIRLRALQTSFSGRCSIRVLEDPRGRLFHPKLFVFERADGSGTVLIGSNNLTPGGLEDNIEAAVYLYDLSTEDMNAWRQFWRVADADPRLKPISDDLIERVRRDRRRVHLNRRRLRVTEESDNETAQANAPVLIRYLAGAGGRTSQVHLSRHIAESYFGLRPNDQRTIDIQMVQPGEPPGRLETNRPLIFSQANRNSKIEMDGIKNRLPRNYPSGWYAILIVQQMEERRYRYMLLVPDNPGYQELSAHLDQVPRHRLALQEEILTLDRLLELWPDYPV